MNYATLQEIVKKQMRINMRTARNLNKRRPCCSRT